MKNAWALALALALLTVVSCATPSAPPLTDSPEAMQLPKSPQPARSAPWLQGKVVDARGMPVADVPVAIHGGLATRWKIGETRTDARGRFVFEQRVEGAAYRANDPGADYVGVCAGNTVGGFNPPAYLPWVDVTIGAGASGSCTLVLDRGEVDRKLATLRAGH